MYPLPLRGSQCQISLISTKHLRQNIKVYNHDLCLIKIFKENGHTKLTPWSTVLLEKVTIPQIVKIFSAFFGTCRFIATYTRTHSLSISWPSNPDAASHHPIP